MVGSEFEGGFGEGLNGFEVGLDGLGFDEVEEVLGGEVFLLGEGEGVEIEGKEGREEMGFAGGEGGELLDGGDHAEGSILGFCMVSMEFGWILLGILSREGGAESKERDDRKVCRRDRRVSHREGALAMFYLLLGALVVLGILVDVAALKGCARLLKRPAKLNRSVVASLVLGIGAIVVGLMAASKPQGAATVVAILAWFVGVWVLVKWSTRARWGRGAGIALCFLAAHTAMGMGLTFGVARQFVQSFVVPTGAMAPTIEPNDRIVVDMMATPRRWDVVVFKAPHEPTVNYVKRPVGLPGETVEIVDGEIRINGKVVAKPAGLEWLKYDGEMKVGSSVGRGCTGSPMTLGADEFYVLGDNTKQSLDSRFWGPPVVAGTQPGALPRGYLMGVVKGIYAPWGRGRVFWVWQRS